MKLIGITGGVGCGKSAILKALESMYSCRIIMADELAKELEAKGEACYEPLITLLGKDILDEDGQIVPAKMASRLYEDPRLLDRVNAIVHPAVKERILSIVEQCKTQGDYDYIFLEAALLIECGYRAVVDELWYIFVTKANRIDRLKKSRGYSIERIEGIMASQLSEEEFRAGCDFVIDNNGTFEDSIRQIKNRLE